MDAPLIARRQRPDRRRGTWLLTLLVAIGSLGAELRGQSFHTECARVITLTTDPSFEDPPESLRYEWRDGRGTVVGRDSQLTVALPVGTHTYVSVVTAPGDRTAEANTTVVVEDTRPPDLVVGHRVLGLPAGADSDPDVDLVAAMRVTADDACDPDPPAITWGPPPPYPAGDTTVTFAATDRAGNRASTQAIVRVAAQGSRLGPVTPATTSGPADDSGSATPRAPGRGTGSSTPPGPGSNPAPPAMSTGTGAGDPDTPVATDTPADVRVSGGPATTASPANSANPGTGVTPAGADTSLATGERASGPGTSPRATSPAATTPLAQGMVVFGIGIPSSGLWWGGVALGVGVLVVALLLITRRSIRPPRTATTTIVFRAVAKPNLNAVHTIRPSYVPPRYRLDLRPHGAAGTHAIVQSDGTPSSHEEP